MKSRFLVALVEVAGAAWITYQQLPAHERQHVRMVTYRYAATILHGVARRIGEAAIKAELKYAREVSSNG